MPEATMVGVFAGVTLLASVFMAVTGFGFSLLATATLFLWYEPRTVVLAVALPGVASTLVAAWRVRRDIPWADLRLYSIWMVVGLPLGVLLLDVIPARGMKAVLAALLFQTVLGGRLPGLGLLRVTPVSAILAGLASGTLGTPGGAVVSWAHGMDWPMARKRAATLGLFSVSGGVRVALYTLEGHFSDPKLLGLAVLMMPPVVVGVWIGGKIAARLDEAQARRWVTAGCVGLLLAMLREVVFER